MFGLTGTILSQIGGLATSWLDNKAAIQAANAEIKKKQLTGEIDWDLEAIKATQHSWKDEYLTLIISIPLILCFCGEWGREAAHNGFLALQQAPDFYKYTLGCVVAASFGIRSATKFFGKK